MASGVSPACLIAAAPASMARVAVVSPGPAIRRSRMPVRSTIHWSLVSTRCSRSALVRRWSGSAVPHPAIAARMLRRLAATRRAGPPGAVRPGARACPRAGRGTGCTPGVEVPGPSRCPTVWPSSTWSPASTSSSGRNTPTEGAMIMRSGTRSPSPWVKRASMGYATSRIVGMSSGVATLRTVTDGAPRLASAASIEPCPTSRKVMAPRPTRVSMVERQRTGTDTWAGSRSRQPVGVGVGHRVVVRDHRGRRARPGRARPLRAASPAVASAISGVWKAPPTLSAVTRRTPISWARADPAATPVGRARDDDLAGSVVVGDPARVGCGGARVVGLLRCGAQQRGHLPGVGVGRGLGELGASGGEAHAVVEGERARRRSAR